MNFKLTKDHDEIRTWIEEQGGQPALRDRNPNQRGVLDVSFNTMPDPDVVSWEEFFDVFDSLNLDFRFDISHEETKEYAYSFINNNEAEIEIEDKDEDENSGTMPEDDIPIENVIPSAPANSSPDMMNLPLNYGGI